MKKQRIKPRKARVRVKILGTEFRPRLSVFRSERFIYGQIIDDKKGKTLVAFSGKGKAKTETAFMVGEKLAKLALAKKIKRVVFDRGSYQYHGRVKALAEGARKGGLEF